MICPNCNTLNEAGNVFCVNCGNTIAASDSAETKVVDMGRSAPFSPPFTPSAGVRQTKNTNPAVWIAGGVIGVLAIAGVAFFLLRSPAGAAEQLPDHLGLFVQSREKDRNEEIPKQDFAKVIDAKNAFMKNDGLLALDPQPSLILYADGKDVSATDLRLIQIDTIKDDGNMKQLDFQVAPVDGKSDMKRIRVQSAIASGKYAFALLDSYFNDGKHKFWAFQVKSSPVSDNGSALKESSLALKPATPSQQAAPRMPAQAAAPAVPPPPGSTVATVSTRSLKLRNGPTQFQNNQIGSLKAGQQVYILNYSDNVETFEGKTSRYAYIRTTGGKEGWAFAAYLR